MTEELALVRAAKKGDDSAYEELVRRYERNVFRIVQHITQNREDAEDVVQDAFLKAYTNLDRFQEQSKFYTWLVRIAVNEALMKLRRRKPERTVSLDEDIKTEDDSVPREIADWSPNPEQQFGQAELKEILGISVDPDFCSITRWPRSMAQYTVGHSKRMDAIQVRLKALPGVYLAGNGYQGIGLSDCIRMGRAAAKAVTSV